MEYFWFDNDSVMGIVQVIDRLDSGVGLRGQAMYIEKNINDLAYWLGSSISLVPTQSIIRDATEQEWRWAKGLGNLTDKDEFRKFIRINIEG